MPSNIQSIKGTRDYYPEEMAIRNAIYDTVRKVSESFGYQEVDGPFIESIELYAAKSGEELVKEQSFVFPDRSGELIALRPELTPSIARMVAQRQKQLVYPLRWWSWGPFWRYERPQKGRSREFFQWNIDLIGIESPEADAELIAIAASFLREIGLKSNQVKILVNNRLIIDSELVELNIHPEKRLLVFRLIDRRDKMSPNEWENYAIEIGLSSQQIQGLQTILGDHGLWRKSNELARTFEICHSLDVGDYIQFAPHIIRGLDYYTGTVFEVWDRDGEFRAILGGGRYDSLVEAVGGDPLPAVGFAMGDLVTSLVLKKFDCLPKASTIEKPPILMTVFDETLLPESFKLATDLRKNGFRVVCYPTAAKLGKQFKFGDRMNLALAIVIGPDELERNAVAVKNLYSGKQEIIPRDKLYENLKELLREQPVS